MIEQLDASDTFLFGRTAYTGMAQYRQTPGAKQDDPAVASRMNNFPKVVISRTLDKPEPPWANARLIKGDVAAALTSMKRESGKTC